MNHEALMAKALGEAVQEILALLKAAEYSSRYHQMLTKPDVYKCTYGYRCYIKAIFEISDYITYSVYSEFKDTIDIVEEEAIECFGYPVLDYFN